MDEESYKAVHTKIVSLQCAFEKSILASRLCCSRSVRKHLAERESVCCPKADAELRCRRYLQLLRQKSQFALHLPIVHSATSVLPHAKEMKVQVGGIIGLGILTMEEGSATEQASAELQDVFSTLESCEKRGGGFAQIPFAGLMRHIARLKVR